MLHQREINLPLYLVCSGRVEGEKSLKGLAELNSDQLLLHYKEKIALNNDDKDLAIALWRTYCGKDHNLFKPYNLLFKKSKILFIKLFSNNLNSGIIILIISINS